MGPNVYILNNQFLLRLASSLLCLILYKRPSRRTINKGANALWSDKYWKSLSRHQIGHSTDLLCTRKFLLSNYTRLVWLPTLYWCMNELLKSLMDIAMRFRLSLSSSGSECNEVSTWTRFGVDLKIVAASC